MVKFVEVMKDGETVLLNTAAIAWIDRCEEKDRCCVYYSGEESDFTTFHTPYETIRDLILKSDV